MGFPGRSGLKGLAGERGLAGLPGFPGVPGVKGGRGQPGLPGLDGAPGLPGLPGISGLPGSRGKVGPLGPRGPPGLPGLDGIVGSPGGAGRNGLTGRRGEKGRAGLKGLVGLPGLKGERGGPGSEGVPGARGASGLDGLPGRPAAPGPAPKPQGFYLAVHSQTARAPLCPPGSSLMWEGYSLLHVFGNAHAQGQDLGRPGSCLKKFSTMPYLFCNLNGVCDYASRNDYSYWLSTTAPMPMMMTPIRGPDIEKYISKCSVCETPTKVIALHSQTLNVPECPENWDYLWEGYSFIMVEYTYTSIHYNDNV